MKGVQSQGHWILGPSIETCDSQWLRIDGRGADVKDDARRRTRRKSVKKDHKNIQGTRRRQSGSEYISRNFLRIRPNAEINWVFPQNTDELFPLLLIIEKELLTAEANRSSIEK